MGSSNKYHTQYEEGKFLHEYFKQETGVFLDIGANDGKTLSNTYDLFLRGWMGVLIEPSPKAFTRLSKLYQDLGMELHQKAIVTHPEDSVSFWESTEHLTNADVALLSSTIHSEISKWSKTPTTFQEITVPCCTLQTVLDESKYKQFDFISIDTEGLDYEILLKVDPISLGLKALCVEYNGIQPEKYIQYMSGYGFKLGLKNGVNLIFTK